jgi:hypothetical protein
MGGYEAGYYGYLWSKVYAQDMFTRFEREGVLDNRAGQAYRDDILAPAGTEDPDTLVRRLLGRPVRTEAFYRELGLSPRALKTGDRSAHSRAGRPARNSLSHGPSGATAVSRKRARYG